MGTQRVQMEGVLPWVVLWALQAGTRDFYPAVPALVGPVRNIFSSPYTISKHAGQAVVQGRASFNVCLWLSYIPSQELRIWPQVERDVLGTDLTVLYLHTVLDQETAGNAEFLCVDWQWCWLFTTVALHYRWNYPEWFGSKWHPRPGPRFGGWQHDWSEP
jgi:hypothetical protein